MRTLVGRQIIALLLIAGACHAQAEIVVIKKAKAQGRTPAAQVQEPEVSQILPFKNWKEQKIVEAQNQVARLGNRLVLLKAGKIKPEDLVSDTDHLSAATGSPTESATALNSRAQKVDRDVQARLERELGQAQKSVEFAKDLTFQEYVMGYLSQFADQPDALNEISSRLSKDEMNELIKTLLRSNQNTLESTEKSQRLKGAIGKLEASANSL